MKLQSIKIRGRLARNAHFDDPTCIVSSVGFSCGLGVSMGRAAKPLLFEGFQAGCHAVCMTAFPCVSTSGTISIRVSIRVRGLHLVFPKQMEVHLFIFPTMIRQVLIHPNEPTWLSGALCKPLPPTGAI